MARSFVGISLSLIVVSFLTGSNAKAEWTPISEADVILSSDIAEIDVKADGAWTMEETREFTVQSEAGKRKVALTRLPYDSNLQKIEVKSAFITTNGRKFILDRHEMQNHEARQPELGLNSIREWILPFTNVEIGSKVVYTFITKSKPDAIPGIFATSFLYGVEFPEDKGKVTVRSVKPLKVAVADNSSSLSYALSQDHGKFVLTVETRNAIYRVPKGESRAFLATGSVPRVDVSTAASWSEITNYFNEKYEVKIKEKLPAEFEAIAQKALKEKNTEDQFSVVTRAISKSMTYVGHWIKPENHFVPRSLAEIARTKTGDCKDFSLVAAAIFRRIGYQSAIALTYRSSPNQEFLKLPALFPKSAVPSPSLFNHAIARVISKEGKTYWIDPTNISSYSHGIFSDIAGSPALVLTTQTFAPELLPDDPNPSDYEFRSIVKFQSDDSVDVKGSLRLSGEVAVQLHELQQAKGEQLLAQVLEGAASEGYKPFKSPTLKLENSLPEDHLATEFQFAAQSPLIEGKEKQKSLNVQLGNRWQLFFVESHKRVSDLYVGPIGTNRSVVSVIGAQVPDEANSDCLVLSPWLDMHRTVSPTTSGFEVRDEITQKKSLVTKQELNSDTYRDFMYRVQECVGSSLITLASADAKEDLKLGPPIALATFDDARKLSTQSGPGIYARSMKAKRIHEKIIAKDPQQFESIAELALTIKDLGYQHDDVYYVPNVLKALDLINTALQNNPDVVALRRARSQLEINLHQTTAATQDFAFVYQKDPKNPKTLKMGFRLSKSLNKIEDAERWGQAYIASLTDKDLIRSARNQLGDLYLDANKFDKAVEAYRGVLATNANDPWTLNNLSIALNKLKRWDEAIDSARKALAISNFGAARSNLSRALREKFESSFRRPTPSSPFEIVQGADPQKIEPLISEAVKNLPSDEYTLYVAASFYETWGKKTMAGNQWRLAANYYDRIVALNPGYQAQSTSAKQMLATADAKGGTLASAPPTLPSGIGSAQRQPAAAGH